MTYVLYIDCEEVKKTLMTDEIISSLKAVGISALPVKASAVPEAVTSPPHPSLSSSSFRHSWEFPRLNEMTFEEGNNSTGFFVQNHQKILIGSIDKASSISIDNETKLTAVFDCQHLVEVLAHVVNKK